jgi:DNA-binding CsgD family transcriptional regulator
MAVGDAAYLFPFLVTGTRAYLADGDLLGAEQWVADVTRAVEQRAIPGTMPAVIHARGLLSVAGGSTGRARRQLAQARDEWLGLGRWWEARWAGIDLARCHLRANRPSEAAILLDAVAADARAIGAQPLWDAADELLRRARARHPTDEPWAPLSAREYEVARLIAEGMTNREIAGALSISPRTVSAHVEHILARLGVSRRAEIAAWSAKVTA